MLTKAGGDDRGTDPRLVKLQDALATPADVQLVSPSSINKGGDAATFTVIPRTRPADPKTADLVSEMRTSVVPSATGGGVTAYVGGVTAANVDLASKISSQLVELILVVLALSIVLLLVAFRSLLVPAQAAVTNLLCVGAAFGVLVATFQWGWGLDLVGLSTPYGTVPIASYVPLMMFAALFGLSMDYEVFLVSRIAQHHTAGEPPRRAVRSGVASSAKVIAAAAIIMISVFGSFILNGDPTIKQFGVGLSVAVLLASAMVLSLAPAMLTLFGRAVWWLPGWLSRLLPHVDIEGGLSRRRPRSRQCVRVGVRQTSGSANQRSRSNSSNMVLVAPVAVGLRVAGQDGLGLAQVAGQPAVGDPLPPGRRRLPDPSGAGGGHGGRQGASNREIAAELFLAPKIVEFHLRRIYHKLGVRSRAQLAAQLAREATPDPPP